MTLRITVLGCSGGIGDTRRTTTFRLGEHMLLDCGSGAGELSLPELAAIDHIFLTHAHLDHIALLPLLLDSVAPRRQRPVTVYALAETIATLRDHVFNWALWPDFTQIPSAHAPLLHFQTIRVGQSITPQPGCTLTVLPARHTVPAVGYQVRAQTESWVFSGDTGGACPAFWAAVNAIPALQALVLETAFPDEEAALAHAAQHLCPALLAQELAHYHGHAPLFITHLKPGADAQIMQQIQRHLAPRSAQQLHQGQVFALA